MIRDKAPDDFTRTCTLRFFIFFLWSRRSKIGSYTQLQQAFETEIFQQVSELQIFESFRIFLQKQTYWTELEIELILSNPRLHWLSRRNLTILLFFTFFYQGDLRQGKWKTSFIKNGVFSLYNALFSIFVLLCWFNFYLLIQNIGWITDWWGAHKYDVAMVIICLQYLLSIWQNITGTGVLFISTFISVFGKHSASEHFWFENESVTCCNWKVLFVLLFYFVSFL